MRPACPFEWDPGVPMQTDSAKNFNLAQHNIIPQIAALANQICESTHSFLLRIKCQEMESETQDSFFKKSPS